MRCDISGYLTLSKAHARSRMAMALFCRGDLWPSALIESLQVVRGRSSYLLKGAFSHRFVCENHWHIRSDGGGEHRFATTGARSFPREHTLFLSRLPLFSVRRAFFKPSQELFGWQCAFLPLIPALLLTGGVSQQGVLCRSLTRR